MISKFFNFLIVKIATGSMLKHLLWLMFIILCVGLLRGGSEVNNISDLLFLMQFSSVYYLAELWQMLPFGIANIEDSVVFVYIVFLSLMCDVPFLIGFLPRLQLRMRKAVLPLRLLVGIYLLATLLYVVGYTVYQQFLR